MWTWPILWTVLGILAVWTLFPFTPFLLVALGYDIGDESNSAFAALPWMILITVPSGVVGFIIWIGVAGYLWLYQR